MVLVWAMGEPSWRFVWGMWSCAKRWFVAGREWFWARAVVVAVVMMRARPRRVVCR